ncbi:MAG: serine/threonine-protein kinase [Gemmatimonadota bacterium]
MPVPPRLITALQDRYRLDREIGAGGMAVVYLAQDLENQRPVAIKVLRPELAAALGPERFLREIQLAAKLQHPHILGLYDSGDAGGLLWYAMPYVPGESLRDRIDREQQLPVDDALLIIQQVAEALGYAHAQGVIHRDIKPENILLTGTHAVVADFGIARALDAAGGPKLTETGMALGTPYYMSPEQAVGSGRLDGRADIYALGCVLYEMLAGQPPFTGPTAQAILARHSVDTAPPLRTVRATVPLAVEQAIAKALAKVPADRFATASQFSDALTRPGAPITREWAPRKLPRRALVSLGAVALLIVGTLVIVRANRSPIASSASLLAVLPFTPNTPDTALARLGGDLMMTVSSTLDQVGELRTVDRAKVLREADRPTTYSIEDATVLGRRFGAGTVVIGSLVHDGSLVRLDLGLYRTDTHAPVGSAVVIRASPDSLIALSDSITMAVLRQIWRNGTPPSPHLADVTTHSLPALREFLEGERDAVAGHWNEAADALGRAVKIDSTFWVAGWQYNRAQMWVPNGEPDSLLTRGYESHLSVFTLRDRLMIEGEGTSETERFEDHLARFRAVKDRFPDDWTVWFFYADHLVHGAPLIGYTKADARAALERSVELNPNLTPAWQHLLTVSLGQDSVDTRSAIDALTRLGELEEESANFGFDAGLLWGTILQLQSSGGKVNEPLLDSLARAVAGSSSGPGILFGSRALAVCGFPAAQIELNRLVLRYEPAPQFVPSYWSTARILWAARGAWDSALVALDAYAARYPERASALDAYQIVVAGAWLGGVDASLAAQRRSAAVAYLDQRPAGEDTPDLRAMLAWCDGLLAVLRRDSRGLSAAREAIRRTGVPSALYLDRSLAALNLPEKQRADSIELDEHAVEGDLGRHSNYPYAMSVNHLAAAQALLAIGDTARAVKQLAWHDADSGGLLWIGQLFAARAYLLRAQVEEAQGSGALARRDYEQFLQRYDMPVASQRHLVDEAKAALRRLGGVQEPPTAR